MSYKNEKNARSWRIRITYSAPLLNQNRTQIFNFLNTLAASSIIFACGGGGGDNTPAVAALELEITPDGGDPIKLNGADLVPEESAGNGAIGSSTARISLGKITSNKNDTTDTIYELADGDDATGTQNEHFTIIGGALFYIGPAVDFETASAADRMFTLKINRYNNADDATNDRNAQPITAVIDLINGKDLPDAPSGLFLRPADDKTSKVYSGGDSTIIENGEATRNLNTLDYGVLAAGADGSTNPVAVGILAHDTQTDGYLDTTKDGAGDGDDIFISYHYTLAVGAGAGYSNNLFTIDDENQLSFIGADSDVSPTYLIGIATTIRVTIELPALTGGVKGYYDVEADGIADKADGSKGDGNIDDREFSFSGGALSKADVAATSSDDAHRNIDVTAGKIYAADFANVAGKIISFDATTLRLPDTAGIYQYHIIVDGAGEVSAVAALPDGTEFYVLGTAETLMVPDSITIDGLTFTDKDGGPAGHDIKIKVSYKTSSGVDIDVVGDTISIKTRSTTFFDDLVTALQNNDKVTALVTATGDHGTFNDLISNYDIATIRLSGGVDEVIDDMDDADPANDVVTTAAVQARTEIAGLIIEATTAGVSENIIWIVGAASGVDNSEITLSGTNKNINFNYGSQATLADFITAINTNTRTNNLVDFVGEAGTDYNPDTLLSDVLVRTWSIAEDGTLAAGEDPTANIGTEQTGAHTWTDEATLDPEDFTIKLAPEDSAAEAVPSAAESVPDTDESAAEATPEAEATKPSIGRRILDYLFGNQEEHRQMQNQQMENMFSGDSDLDPITPTDPDIL